MKIWAFVPLGAVLTAMVLIPELPHIQRATLVEAKSSAPAELKLLKPAPTFGMTSRSPVSAFASSQKPLAGVRICVDPGHGGQAQWSKTFYTGGTVGVATGQTESDVNLRVGLLLRQYLEAAGADVVLTRLSDDRVSCTGSKTEELDCRTSLANQKNCDLFVSVHHNEAVRQSTNYTAVFFPSGVPRAAALADNISASVSRYLGTTNMGPKVGQYRVLRTIKMPGVIVEASFLSNPQEDTKLQSLSYNKLQAKAIATGILNYMRAQRQMSVDFNTIFAPIDDKAGSAQAMADASLVRRQVVERKSLFGIRYDEVVTDASGNVTSRREVGGNSLANQMARRKSQSAQKDSKDKQAANTKTVAGKGKTAAKGSTAKPSVAAVSHDADTDKSAKVVGTIATPVKKAASKKPSKKS